MSTIHPTTVATVWHSMQSICREMRYIIERTAQNFLIAQLRAQQPVASSREAE